ncbi:hypothetical protein ACA040_002246 [Xenophilus aerolatus]
MANLNETDEWFAGIYQLEEDDPVLGGPAGIDNLAPRQLASRSLYQRMRNVTPWSALLAYPADTAYVSHAGTTWKSVAASTDVQPGSDDTKWVRWAHTAAELAEAIGDSMANHVAAANPHPQYATDADLAAHVAASDPHPQYATDADLAAHAAALNPHAQYATTAALNAEKFGRLLAVQRFASSGTYTPTAGATKALVYVIGAGGGGGGGFATSSGSYSVGSGGGSGAMAVVLVPLAGGSAPVTVGAGGSSALGGAGIAGGTSSFGGTSAPGGGGGGTATTATTGNSVSGQGAPGATPTIAAGHTQVLACGGNPGACGFIFSNFGPTSGQGGASPLGGGGGTNTSGGLGGIGNTPGAGGGGSANNVSVGNTNGGTGANGLVLVYEFG